MPHSPLHTPLTRGLGCRYPFICLGGRPAQQAEFAAAVGQAGGLGCLNLASAQGVQIREQVQACRALSQRPFALYLEPSSIPRSLFAEQIEACLAAGVDTVMVAMGTAPRLIEPLAQAGLRVLAQVEKVGQAMAALDAGADMLIADPQLARELIALDRAPVIANGILGTGRAMAAALSRGAQGVMCRLPGYAIENFELQEHYAQRLAQWVGEAQACLAPTAEDDCRRFTRSADMAMAYRARKGTPGRRAGLALGA